MSNFDPYYKWLGIPLKDQPPNHYRLLAIDLYESDPDVVSIAADQRMKHVRSFQTGKHSAISQKILNEIASAKICLLNTDKKAEYDEQLQQRIASAVLPSSTRPKNPPNDVPQVVVSDNFSVPIPDLGFIPIQTKLPETAKQKLPNALWVVLGLLAVSIVAVILTNVRRQDGSKNLAQDVEDSSSQESKTEELPSEEQVDQGPNGDYDQSVGNHAEAVRFDPGNAEAYYKRGNAYLDKGDYDKAIADFNEAIRLNPKKSEAYAMRGWAYEESGVTDKAIADFTEAIGLAPKDAEAYFLRGWVYGDRDELDKAIGDYTEAIRLNPKFSEAHHERGEAYEKKGEKAKAEADFAQAEQLGYEQ